MPQHLSEPWQRLHPRVISTTTNNQVGPHLRGHPQQFLMWRAHRDVNIDQPSKRVAGDALSEPRGHLCQSRSRRINPAMPMSLAEAKAGPTAGLADRGLSPTIGR